MSTFLGEPQYTCFGFNITNKAADLVVVDRQISFKDRLMVRDSL